LFILISPADAQTSSTSCSSTSTPPSPQCCWVKRSWQLMGKTTSVSSTSSTACCYYLVSSTGTITTQASGIPGVTCTSSGTVTELKWNGQALRYSIPTELSNFKNLTYLGLYNNQLNGTIPSSLGNLVELQDLWLQKNQLNGTIPSSLGQLVKLYYLYLDNNQLTGQIPSSLGNLVKLWYLYLHTNQLTGPIPTSLGQLVTLRRFDLYNNQLTGPIPTSLGQLVRLQYFYFHNNIGLIGTFTPQCLTSSGAIPSVWISGTNVTICGCAAASNPPACFPHPGTPAACLSVGPALTLSKRILAFSQVIEGYTYSCNTDSNKNPYSDCLNSMAKMCNTTDYSSFDKTRCHTGVNMMFGNMSTLWQNVRKECGQWSWTQNGQTFVGNSASSNCATANSNMTAKAYYIQDGIRVNVTSGLTESIKARLWSNTLLAP